PEEQKKVDQAIAKGVDFLKDALVNNRADWYLPRYTGAAALAGLTLLNCGVPAPDPAVKKVIDRVRQAARMNSNYETYELAVCIWSRARLKAPQDKALIQSLALRLIASQSTQGGWDYRSRVLAAEEEKQLLTLLKSANPAAVDAAANLKGLPVFQF